MAFNAQKNLQAMLDELQNYFRQHDLGGAVIGISGGKDSSVAAAVLCKALGAERVTALWLPCHSSATDLADAERLAAHLGLSLLTFDVQEPFEALRAEAVRRFAWSEAQRHNSDLNAKPRLRMVALYYVAAALTAEHGKPYIVIGTSNKSERFVGYFTKWGDGAWDLGLLADLTVAEVIALGRALGLPEDLLLKTPSDGISKQSDEEKLGVSYADIERYMDDPQHPELSPQTAARIAEWHAATAHKFQQPYFHRRD